MAPLYGHVGGGARPQERIHYAEVNQTTSLRGFVPVLEGIRDTYDLTDYVKGLKNFQTFMGVYSRRPQDTISRALRFGYSRCTYLSKGDQIDAIVENSDSWWSWSYNHNRSEDNITTYTIAQITNSDTNGFTLEYNPETHQIQWLRYGTSRTYDSYLPGIRFMVILR